MVPQKQRRLVGIAAKVLADGRQNIRGAPASELGYAAASSNLTPTADQLHRIEPAECLVGSEGLEAGDDITRDNLPVVLLAFACIKCHVFSNPANSKEALELAAGREAKQPAEFGPGQATGAVFLGSECLQRPARHVAGTAEPDRQVVGNGQGHIHAASLADAVSRQ